MAMQAETMNNVTAKATWRAPPPLIPLIAAIPVLFALTTFPRLGSIWSAADFNRFFSIPVSLVEIVVISMSAMRGIDLTAPIRGERPWVWAALTLLFLVAFGTAQFVAIDPFTAWLRTLAWVVHLMFGLSVAGLAQKYWVGRAQEIWWWILAGLLLHLVIIIAFVATLQDPKHYPWIEFSVSVINVRQLGFYSAAGFSIAIGIAIMSKTQRTRWAAVVVAGLMIALSFWSGTRSSVLSSIGALVVAGLFLREVRSLRSAKLILVSFVLGAGLSLIYSAPEPAMGLFRIFTDSARGSANQISSRRVEIWISTAHTILKRPMFGYGESQFKIVEPSVHGEYNHPHNSFLQFLFQWGFVGASCFFGLMALLARRLSAAVRNNLDDALPAGLLAVNMFAMSQIEGSLYHPYPVMIAVFALAYVLACSSNSKPRHQNR
jgi:O-antigen ligase